MKATSRGFFRGMLQAVFEQRLDARGVGRAGEWRRRSRSRLAGLASGLSTSESAKGGGSSLLVSVLQVVFDRLPQCDIGRLGRVAGEALAAVFCASSISRCACARSSACFCAATTACFRLFSASACRWRLASEQSRQVAKLLLNGPAQPRRRFLHLWWAVPGAIETPPAREFAFPG